MTILLQPEPKPWFYRQIALEQKFSGIPDYLKRQELKATIRALKSELSAVKAIPPGNDDIRAIAHESFEKFKTDAVVQLSAFLHRTRGMADPFSQHEDMRRFLLPFLFDEKMIDAAVDLMPTEGSMPISEKKKRVAKLEKDIDKKTTDLEKASPPNCFEWKHGKPVTDLYEEFERDWRSVQARLSGPCNIQGILLAACSPQEQEAWQKLGIRSAMNTSAKNAPYAP
jgi:hypothetical protein